MPQTTVLPDWKATYPTDAAAQKVPGLSPPPSTTLIANAVPNKPQPWTSTTIVAPYVVAQQQPEGEGVSRFAAAEAAEEEVELEEKPHHHTKNKSHKK